MIPWLDFDLRKSNRNGGSGTRYWSLSQASTQTEIEAVTRRKGDMRPVRLYLNL